MKKKIKVSLAALFCVCVLFSGCQKEKEIPKPASTERVTLDTQTEETGLPDIQTEDVGLPDTQTGQETDAYRYVAFGNSVTCGEITENLWWGNWGMAASSMEKDYVHILSAEIEQRLSCPVETEVYSLKPWELAQDRSSLLEDISDSLDETTDLVTIQSGENITQFQETLQIDYYDLVSFIKEKAPNAQILMLGELLWPNPEIETAKQTACQACEVAFIEMTQYLTDYEANYKSSIGDEVIGEDGETHKITDEEVAAHPNDEGMVCIAGQILPYIQTGS